MLELLKAEIVRNRVTSAGGLALELRGKFCEGLSVFVENRRSCCGRYLIAVTVVINKWFANPVFLDPIVLSFTRFPVPVVSVPPPKDREVCAIREYCPLPPASEETEAWGSKTFGVGSLRKSVTWALPKASGSAGVPGRLSLGQDEFYIGTCIFFLLYNLQQGFPDCYSCCC